jgi:hypothetical protein
MTAGPQPRHKHSRCAACAQVRDVSSTARGRIRWLETSLEAVKRRLEAMYREMEGSLSLTVRLSFG